MTEYRIALVFPDGSTLERYGRELSFPTPEHALAYAQRWARDILSKTELRVSEIETTQHGLSE